jgi:hypothetical protein
MKMANCGASVKSSQKPKKMNQGGFMKIGDDLQMLDVNRDKKRMGMSSGGIAERKRKEEAEKKMGKKVRRGELVEANKGKAVRKKK